MVGLISSRGEFYVLGLTNPHLGMSGYFAVPFKFIKLQETMSWKDDQRVFLLEALWII
jgi:hypothetical protein